MAPHCEWGLRPGPAPPQGPAQPPLCSLGSSAPPQLAHPSPGSRTLLPHRISSYCKSKGWQRIQDSRREDYMLKWCEVKRRDSYCSFREGSRRGGARASWGGCGGRGAGVLQGPHNAAQGFVVPGDQLLYQLPNNKLLTTKIGLLNALREYSRVTNKIHKAAVCAQAK